MPFTRSFVPTLPAARRTLLLLVLAACSPGAPVDHRTSEVPHTPALLAAAREAGLVRVEFPGANPGIPAYARLGQPLNQTFHDGQTMAIPFYRNPEMIPEDFNMLTIFDFPGPGGPGAFGVPLTVTGFFMTEANAAPTTFPRLVISQGHAVPIWFVDWATFRQAMQDNVVTMGELRTMRPVRGVASKFTETLRPRVGEHLLVINAQGNTDDGRSFTLHITHVEAEAPVVRIALR